jgi:hypothetical protein
MAYVVRGDGRLSPLVKMSILSDMTRCLPVAGSVLAVAVLLSGCGSVGRSEAYQVGVEAGEEIKGIRDQADVISSWLDEADELVDDASADPESYCAAAWPLAGIANGLRNSPDNKRDFIKGCTRGSR